MSSDDSISVLNDRGDFWRLLARVTVCRAINELAKSRRQSRPPSAGKLDGVEWIAGSAPPPDLLVMAAEDFEALLNRLDLLDDDDGSRNLRGIAVGIDEGHTPAELADRLSCSRTRVARKLELIKKALLPEDLR